MTDDVMLVTPDRQPWTHERDSAAWARIEELSETAVCAVWDGCHKIYLAMDPQSEGHLNAYPYATYTGIYGWIEKWWCNSCSLRFVSTIRNGGMTNDDYDDVLPQLFTIEGEE